MKPCLLGPLIANRFSIISLWVLLIAGISACSPVQLRVDPVAAPAIDRDRCETDEDFAFIPAGEFIRGSDRAERDYAYRISAEATARNPDRVAPAEQRLRQQGWFDREPERQIYSGEDSAPSPQQKKRRQTPAEPSQSNKPAGLPAFCIGRNLVTNTEYQAFVQATGHRLPGISAAEYQKQGFLVHPYKDVKPFLWKDAQYPEGEGQHPVVLVSYEDALAFARWRGKPDSQSYRLPTALEWERAARGTDGRYFPWGNDWRDRATNWAKSGLWHTSAIATFPLSRSPDGVEDMAGNVFEFTSTLKRRRYSSGERTVSVMKGCSWDDLPGFCRAAYQHTRPIESRHILFGFRLVRQ